MRGKNTIIIPLLLAFTLITIKSQAQSCQCWQQRDASFQPVPFATDETGSPISPPYYRNDDGYTNPITLPFSFCFYGTSVNQITIDENGYVIWGSGTNGFVNGFGSSSYQPESLPLAISPSMICPYWSDVETRGATGPNSNIVYYKVTPDYVVIQWDSVSYYAAPNTSQDNSFQLIISNGTDPIIPYGNNIEFCYKDMQWAVASSQGGSTTNGFYNATATAPIYPSLVGINEGNGLNNAIQYGLFGSASNLYAGTNPSGPNYDGVFWLDNQEFYMNGCTGEAPPLVNWISPCDTFTICSGTTLTIPMNFYTVFNGLTIHSVLGTPLTPGVSIIYNNSSAQGDSVDVQFSPTAANVGTNVIAIDAYDNANPADTLFAKIVVIVLPGGGNLVTTATPDTVCSGNSATLSATGGTSYVWSQAGATTTSITVSPNITSTYTVTAGSGGCSSTASIQVVVGSPPSTIVNPSDTALCQGASVTLNASGATTYNWNPGNETGSSVTVSPTTSTVYTVVGSNGIACPLSTVTASVTVNPLPMLSVSHNVSICAGMSTKLIATANGDNFVWSPGNQTDPIISVSPLSTETYTVTFTNSCGSISNNVTVSVNPQPLPSFSADIRSGCSPLCIQFHDNTTIASGGVEDQIWVLGDGDTTHTLNPIYCYNTPGQYPVTLITTSDSGCGATLEVGNYITVFSHPNAAFSINPQPANILEPTIQFTDKSTDAYGLSEWFWSFGDATDSLAVTENASHTYSDTGTYCVRLITMNYHGCVDSVTDCFAMEPIYTLYIPDAFSPDGNGRNDIFLPKGNDIKSFEMYIFDRWGTQVFHSTDINEGWNGGLNGGTSMCQEDTYVYLITVHDGKNKSHSYTGIVNLIK